MGFGEFIIAVVAISTGASVVNTQRTENQVQNLERRVRQIESGSPTMENILGRK